MNEIRNAKISSTHLGVEDHNITTAMLTLDYGGVCQGFGGWSLDTPKKINGKFVKRVGTAFGMEFIMQILETLEVGETSGELLSSANPRPQDNRYRTHHQRQVVHAGTSGEGVPR
jgi:hypothetical protein